MTPLPDSRPCPDYRPLHEDRPRHCRSCALVCAPPGCLEVLRPDEGQVAEYARKFWENMGGQSRRYVLWDTPSEDREDFFPFLLERADFCASAHRHGVPSACAWIFGCGINAKAGIVHFAMASIARPAALALGLRFLRLAQKAGYASLLCLIPRHFVSQTFFARQLGFGLAARLDEAAWIAPWPKCPDGMDISPLPGFGKHVDALLYTLNLRDLDQALDDEKPAPPLMDAARASKEPDAARSRPLQTPCPMAEA